MPVGMLQERHQLTTGAALLGGGSQVACCTCTSDPPHARCVGRRQTARRGCNRRAWHEEAALPVPGHTATQALAREIGAWRAPGPNDRIMVGNRRSADVTQCGKACDWFSAQRTPDGARHAYTRPRQLVELAFRQAREAAREGNPYQRTEQQSDSFLSRWR
jgi:hypothetical protein